MSLTLARPYARAAFAVARDAGKPPGWSEALGLAAREHFHRSIAERRAHPVRLRDAGRERALGMGAAQAAGTFEFRADDG